MLAKILPRDTLPWPGNASLEKSDGHCKAMMDTPYVEMGAYSYGYCVQKFGR